ncbi:signal recognition particle-docking protein FtsY [Ezakiella coagulans]|uniref:signal recognition particle-docking protein FtsY n=1 Tax=Ezakiella coagulans TaxID=46507 RepID=UPI00288B84C8|nr:signal recognition particle-docking protein FtsY [Ezakiella coagulans]
MFNWFKNKFSKKKENDENKIEEVIEESTKKVDEAEISEPIFQKKTESHEIKNESTFEKKVETHEEAFKNETIKTEVPEKKEEPVVKQDVVEEKHVEPAHKIETHEEIKEEPKQEVVQEKYEEPKKELIHAAVKKELENTNDEEELKDTKESIFKRFMKGVNKTRKNFSYQINSVFTENDIDDDFYEELEEVMVMGDIGASTTMTIIDILKERIVDKGIHKTSEAKELLKEIILEVMNEHIEDNYLHLEPSPAILMLVGVNGVGKTTTCGKLAYQFKQEGKSVAIIAADTFRAAAIEQLEVWGERAGVKIISQKEGSDPAAVVFDGLDYSIKNNIDITIIDTAGRLHNKVNLMNELNKVKRIIDKKMPNATMEVILALDATTGQNALLQVKEFKEAAEITGVSLNKLDGTAKGGVIIPIQYEEKIPVKIVGVGESIYDLQPFEPELFVNAIFE